MKNKKNQEKNTQEFIVDYSWFSDYSSKIESGRDKYMTNNFRGSIEDFTVAINICKEIKSESIDEKISPAYFERGKAKFRIDNFQGAIEDFTVAIENYVIWLEASNFSCLVKCEYYNNRGRAKIAINDYEGAIEDFKKEIEISIKSAKDYDAFTGPEYPDPHSGIFPPDIPYDDMSWDELTGDQIEARIQGEGDYAAWEQQLDCEEMKYEKYYQEHYYELEKSKYELGGVENWEIENFKKYKEFLNKLKEDLNKLNYETQFLVDDINDTFSIYQIIDDNISGQTISLSLKCSIELSELIIKLISLYKEIGGENILLVSAVNSSIVTFEAAVKAFCIRDERNFAFISEKIAEEKKEKGKKRKKDKDISDIDTLPF